MIKKWLQHSIYFHFVVLSIVTMALGFLVGVQYTEASTLGFSVETVIPENQVDKSKTFFDLKGEVGSNQVLEVKLHNHTDREVKVESTIAPATTNLNGVVEYGPRDQKLDASLKYNLAELLTYKNEKQKKEIVIPKNGETNVKFDLKYPGEPFEGVVAGGLSFKEIKSDKESETTGNGLAIENEYAFVVAVILHGITDDIQSVLEMKDVFTGQVNARNVINANLQNPEPKYLNQLVVDAKVTKFGQDEVVYQQKMEGMQMAPNSNFDFPVHLEGKRLEAGKYTLTLKADSMEDTWTFKKDFQVTAKKAKELNEKDVTIKPNNTWIYITVGLIILLIVIGINIFLIYRNKKAKKRKTKRKKKVNRNTSKKNRKGRDVSGNNKDK